MPACARWRCTAWLMGAMHECEAGYSAQQPDLAAGGAGAGDPAASHPSAAVDHRPVAGLRGLANPDLPHARSLPAQLDQGAADDRGGIRSVLFPRQPGRARGRCGAADCRIHPQAGGDEYPPRFAGADLSRLLRGGDQLPVRGQPACRALQPPSGHRIARRDDRPAAEQPGDAAVADRAAGRRAAVAGGTTDASAVPVLSPPAAAVVAAAGRRQGYDRSGRLHGAWRYRAVGALGGAGVSCQLRRRDSPSRPALLARGDLRAFRWPALVAVLRIQRAPGT